MKNKKKGHVRIYVICLFLFCLLLDDFLEGFYDFCIGFYEGFLGYAPHSTQANQTVEMLRQNDWVAVLFITLLVSIIFYIQMKRKVANPIEQLTESMKLVSEGKLDVRVSVNGAYELGQMEESFNDMVEELENARQIKEQLYSEIAHDLKTPMTMIKGYAKVLESEASIKEEDKKRYFQTIVEQTEHANHLLDSLLAYSKLGNQSYPLQKEHRDIAESLRTCVAEYYSLMEQEEMEVEIQIPDREVKLYFDETEMRRVFNNLLSNMLKHNPKKTACVIRLEEKGQKIQLVMGDNGPKIPKGLCDTLFEAFTLGDDSRNTKNGSGLGLAIVKIIVERHGGSIRYEENWNQRYKAFVIELGVL